MSGYELASDHVATLWTALTPDTRPESPYVRLTSDLPEDKAESTDRTFLFEPLERVPEEQTTDGAVTRCRWTFLGMIFFSPLVVGRADLGAVLAREGDRLSRVVERDESLPSSVLECTVIRASFDVDGASITIEFEALTEETAS